MHHIGPKTIIQALPSITTPEVGNERSGNVFSYGVSNNVILNDAPRSGQSWNLESIYFSFPQATQLKPWEFSTTEFSVQFFINLKIGSRTVAEQIFKFGETKEGQRLNPVGNLEAFSPNVVYPAESIAIEYKLQMIIGLGFEINPTKIKHTTGEGAQAIISYTQDSR